MLYLRFAGRAGAKPPRRRIAAGTRKNGNNFAAYAYSIRLNRLIGELGRQLTQDLLKIFGKGFCLDGEIAAISKDENEKFRCSVRVFNTSSMMAPYLEELPYLFSERNE